MGISEGSGYHPDKEINRTRPTVDGFKGTRLLTIQTKRGWFWSRRTDRIVVG